MFLKWICCSVDLVCNLRPSNHSGVGGPPVQPLWGQATSQHNLSNAALPAFVPPTILGGRVGRPCMGASPPTFKHMFQPSRAALPAFTEPPPSSNLAGRHLCGGFSSNLWGATPGPPLRPPLWGLLLQPSGAYSRAALPAFAEPPPSSNPTRQQAAFPGPPFQPSLSRLRLPTFVPPTRQAARPTFWGFSSNLWGRLRLPSLLGGHSTCSNLSGPPFQPSLSASVFQQAEPLEASPTTFERPLHMFQPFQGRPSSRLRLPTFVPGVLGVDSYPGIARPVRAGSGSARFAPADSIQFRELPVYIYIYVYICIYVYIVGQKHMLTDSPPSANLS